jgi:uncharacterized membrane protein
MDKTYLTSKTEETPSKAAIVGHPIHPMLIPFPIAFLAGTLISDIVFLISEEEFWARASFWLLIAGIISGGIAAIFGFIDFSSRERIREFKMSWYHMFGNGVVLVLAIISAYMRSDDPAASVRPWGITLSVIITLLLVVTGWLGGELVYKHKIGISSE